MADMLRQRGDRMQWYGDELLHMAKELGHRLLPAFNTTSGLPYPRVTHLTLHMSAFRSSPGCKALLIRTLFFHNVGKIPNDSGLKEVTN